MSANSKLEEPAHRARDQSYIYVIKWFEILMKPCVLYQGSSVRNPY